MLKKISKELNVYYGEKKGYGTYSNFLGKQLTLPVFLVIFASLFWLILRPDAINAALLFAILVISSLTVLIPVIAYAFYKIDSYLKIRKK